MTDEEPISYMALENGTDVCAADGPSSAPSSTSYRNPISTFSTAS